MEGLQTGVEDHNDLYQNFHVYVLMSVFLEYKSKSKDFYVEKIEDA